MERNYIYIKTFRDRTVQSISEGIKQISFRKDLFGKIVRDNGEELGLGSLGV